MIKELIEYIVKTLVDKPELVEVTTTREGSTLMVGVKVQEDDLGRIIGKDGQTIRALRTLAMVVAPEHEQVHVDIIK